MVHCLEEKGYNIISGGTDNHLILIDLRNKSVTGKQAEQALVRADLTVNKNMVPFDDQSPMITSGVRIGTEAITTRGLDEKALHPLCLYSLPFRAIRSLGCLSACILFWR